MKTSSYKAVAENFSDIISSRFSGKFSRTQTIFAWYGIMYYLSVILPHTHKCQKTKYDVKFVYFWVKELWFRLQTVCSKV
jgi:hypothetical protein